MPRRNADVGLKLPDAPRLIEEQILTIHTPLYRARHPSRKGNRIESYGNRDGQKPSFRGHSSVGFICWPDV